MRTPKTESTKELYKQVKSLIEQDKSIEVDFSKESGGSISNLPVKTDYYNTWLVEQQERNLFIGKNYITRSDADEVESEIIGDINVSDDISSAKIDITLDESSITDGLTNDKSDEFINFSLIENNIKLLIGKPEDEIKQILTDQISEHHKSLGKKEYTVILPENIDEMITETKQLLLGNYV